MTNFSARQVFLLMQGIGGLGIMLFERRMSVRIIGLAFVVRGFGLAYAHWEESKTASTKREEPRK